MNASSYLCSPPDPEDTPVMPSPVYQRTRAVCNGFNSSERVSRDTHTPVSSAAAAEWLLREEPQPNLLLSNGPPPRELIG
ncbi:hypothetical protein PBY51_011132 [Eleginops maclovinus]|uniref:Uncharacterized protein n=1 Tax=Eleginops maclovinus TaxID=56733 RepID=A0AAN8AFE1_ELEMC|nr:hypothetical protein PBY51_011132 [Eleginops maclovinus]